MSEKKQNEYRGRVYFIELYPNFLGLDDELYLKDDIKTNMNYLCVKLDTECECREWAYILHDKDIKDSSTGEFKKSHIHLLIKLEKAVRISKVAKVLGIEENYIEIPKRRDSYEIWQRYLIHKGWDSKTPYLPNEVNANYNYYAVIEKDGHIISEFNRIIQAIENGEIINKVSLIKYCQLNYSISVLNKYYKLLCDYLLEYKEYINIDEDIRTKAMIDDFNQRLTKESLINELQDV